MELKQIIDTDGRYQLALLIVPYGIETYKFTYTHLAADLLIVPYGIET